MYLAYQIILVVLGACIGVLAGVFYHHGLLPLLGIVGVLVGFGIGRLVSEMDKRKAYIINAKNALLIAINQVNEFINIKSDFAEFKDDAQRHIKTPSRNISHTEWRLSKQEVLSLNKGGDEEIIKIMFDLILLDKSFKGLLLAIEDYNNYRNPIVKRWQDFGELILSSEEADQMKRYLNKVYGRLEKIDFLPSIEKLHEYLNGKYPGEKFPKPDIKK